MIILFLLCFSCLGAIEPLKEIQVEGSFDFTLDEKLLKYQVVSGNLNVKDKATIGYTAYFLEGDHRPITFCFNGGPGAASIWLNSGFLGPKRIEGEEIFFQNPPYILVDNESSLLDQTDLVFIDPVSTGFGRPATGVNLTELHGVDEDVELIADFIRLFTARFHRFDSAKYFVGESYGALRAAKVAYKLHEDYGYYLNGIAFISPALDLQTISPGGCNDLPYQLSLPTLTAVAHYHGKITGDLDLLLKEVKAFAEGPYAHALYVGDQISDKEKKEVIEKLSHFTSLSRELIERLNLRIPTYRFIKEFLQNEGKVIGRFDGRIVGIDSNESDVHSPYDPSVDAVLGAVTATFTQFLIKDLKWPELMDYHVLVSLTPWNWGKGNQYASCLKEIRNLMAQNPQMKIAVMSGIYDLATPLSSVEYALTHTGLDPIQLHRIHHYMYPAGHMMYYNQSIRKAMKRDIIGLYK